MLVDLFDLLGHLLRNQTQWLYSTLMFNKSTATRLEAVDLLIPLILTEETLTLLTEARILARLPLRFLLLSLTEHGLFNGHGLEELSLWETTSAALITPSMEVQRL